MCLILTSLSLSLSCISFSRLRLFLPLLLGNYNSATTADRSPLLTIFQPTSKLIPFCLGQFVDAFKAFHVITSILLLFSFIFSLNTLRFFFYVSGTSYGHEKKVPLMWLVESLTCCLALAQKETKRAAKPARTRTRNEYTMSACLPTSFYTMPNR